jgi:preflagellin peptidase FlaK
MALGVASVPDLLRLLFVPVFAWAAYRDVQTRRLPNRLWPPLALLGLLTLAWDAVVRFPFAGYDDRVFLIRVGFALVFLLPFSYAAYLLRAFGGADAKAMMVLAVGFPITPQYELPTELVAALPPGVATALPRLSLPLYPSVLGVVAMSALTNAVLVALLFVLGLALRNAVAGRVSLAMFVGWPTSVDDVPERYGTLLDTDGTLPSSGLDLDALRMYLRWRGCSLADLRSDPARFRDPASVGETFEPTDGAVHRRETPVRDGGDDVIDDSEEGDEWAGTGFVSSKTRQAESSDAAETDEPARPATDESESVHDPWAAEAFLDDVDGSAYGTTPESLREGLQTVAGQQTVWVSPGLPFVVPLFGGLLVALTYGDALTVLLQALGIY